MVAGADVGAAEVGTPTRSKGERVDVGVGTPDTSKGEVVELGRAVGGTVEAAGGDVLAPVGLTAATGVTLGTTALVDAGACVCWTGTGVAVTTWIDTSVGLPCTWVDCEFVMSTPPRTPMTAISKQMTTQPKTPAMIHGVRLGLPGAGALLI